jgi:membrane-associated phospholipid phosphatase
MQEFSGLMIIFAYHKYAMKRKIIDFCKANKALLISFAVVWVCLFAFDCMYPKIQTHLMLNGYHTPVLDTFFKYTTKLGEEFPIYLGVVLLIFNRRNGLLVLLGQGLTCIFTQALKYAFAHPRPATFFKEMGVALPDTVDGVKLHTAFNSFPSGHTSSAFALFTCLALITPRKWAPLWMTAAWVVAYSRIYLSQHFLEDTLLGSFIGMVSSCAVYLIMDHFVNKKRK